MKSSSSSNLLGNAPEPCPRPFFAARGRLLVGTHDRRIYHQMQVLAISHQVAEHLVPHPACRPATEPLVHALVLAITVGKIMLVSARAKYSQHTVDENTVVRRRPTYALHSTRQQSLDPTPLRIAQLITTHAHQNRTSNQRSPAKSVCRYPLVVGLST
jgi:hypothetical protein